jgi:hypothetical protein
MDIPLWRDISILLLVAEAFVLALVPMAAVYLVNMGLRQLRNSLQSVFPPILLRVLQAELVTVRASELLVKPIIATYSLAARVLRVSQVIVGLPWGGPRR